MNFHHKGEDTQQDTEQAVTIKNMGVARQWIKQSKLANAPM